jgi:GAF domain-containing protein
VARSREHLAVLRALACRSSITVPLMTGGRVHGVMTFALCESRRWYGDDDLPVALAIARCAAIAAENARLYRHAHATLRSAVGRSPGRRTRPTREGPPKTQDVGR